MLSKRHQLSIIPGLIAGLLFSASSYGYISGLFCIYLPLFPLLVLGLGFGARSFLFAGFVALAPVLLLTDINDVLFFAAFILLPGYYFTRKALLWRGDADDKQWYPLILLLTELIVMASVLFMVLQSVSLLAGQGGLETLIINQFDTNVAGVEPQLAETMKKLVSIWSFLIFAWTGWLWVLVLYVFAVLANNLLKARKFILRPHLTLTPHRLPMWLLGLLLLSALFAFLGSPSDRFSAKTVFLMLLLPYFLFGIALFHEKTRSWQYRNLWMILFYTVLLLAPLSALLVVGTGLYVQLAEMLDRRAKMG